MRPSSSPGPNLRVLLAELGGAVLGGGVFAAVLGISLGLVLSGLNLGMGLLGVIFYAAILGFGIGTSIGVVFVGRLLNQLCTKVGCPPFHESASATRLCVCLLAVEDEFKLSLIAIPNSELV